MEILTMDTTFEIAEVLKEISLIEFAANLRYQSDDRIINILYEITRDSFLENNPGYYKRTANNGKGSEE